LALNCFLGFAEERQQGVRDFLSSHPNPMFILLMQLLIHLFPIHQRRHRLRQPVLMRQSIPLLVFNKVLHLHLDVMFEVLMHLIQCHCGPGEPELLQQLRIVKRHLIVLLLLATQEILDFFKYTLTRVVVYEFLEVSVYIVFYFVIFEV
jgi:hypothetical protein